MESEPILKTYSVCPIGNSDLYYEYKDECIVMQPMNWVAFTSEQLSSAGRIQQRFFQLCSSEQFPMQRMSESNISHMTALGTLVVFIKRLNEYRNNETYYDYEGLTHDLSGFDVIEKGRYTKNDNGIVTGVMKQGDLEIVSQYPLASQDRTVWFVCDRKHKKLLAGIIKFLYDHQQSKGLVLQEGLTTLIYTILCQHAMETNMSSDLIWKEVVKSFVSYFCYTTSNKWYSLNIKTNLSLDRSKDILVAKLFAMNL